MKTTEVGTGEKGKKWQQVDGEKVQGKDNQGVL